MQLRNAFRNDQYNIFLILLLTVLTLFIYLCQSCCSRTLETIVKLTITENYSILLKNAWVKGVHNFFIKYVFFQQQM